MRISVVLPLLLPDPFTLAMTQFCIKALRYCAKAKFELVIVETGSRHFVPDKGGPVDPLLLVDKYVHIPTKSSYVLDFNTGCGIASGDYIVHMGNDVIVNDGWDKALLEPFDRYSDCGVTCCAASEPGAFIGPRSPLPVVVEGMFAPMMMFDKKWRLDEAFEGGYSDSDLIMRMYVAGLRAYRNCSVIVHHLDRITWSRAYNDRGEAQMQRGETLFHERWGNSPLMMYQMIRAGGVIYGKEHESLLAHIPPRAQRAK